MQVPLEHRFGPHDSGISRANASLCEFLKTVQLDWTNESRDDVPRSAEGMFLRGRPIASLLHDVRLDAELQRELNQLRHYGFADLGVVAGRFSDEQIAALQRSLPFFQTYALDGHAVNILELQHNLRAWAVIYALYLLLNRTEYWQNQQYPVSPFRLGMLPERNVIRGTFTEQVGIMHRYSRTTGFYPLDVLGRMFSPKYFHRLLAHDLEQLPPAENLSHLRPSSDSQLR